MGLPSAGVGLCLGAAGHQPQKFQRPSLSCFPGCDTEEFLLRACACSLALSLSTPSAAAAVSAERERDISIYIYIYVYNIIF